MDTTTREVLLKSQWDDVFKRVVAAGFSPSHFERVEMWSPINGSRAISVLRHRPNPEYWFKFDRGGRGGHYAIYSPGAETGEERQYPGPWVGQLEYVDKWLVYLRRELEAPDLWSGLASGAQAQQSISNEPFTSTELEAISERLARIEKHFMETRALQEGEASYVRESLDFLRTSAKTEGRRTWTNMAIGVIFNIVLFLALPADAAGALFKFAVEQVQMFGTPLAVPLPLPQPGPPPPTR